MLFVVAAATAVCVPVHHNVSHVCLSLLLPACCRYVSRAGEHFAALRRRALLASARALMLGDYHNSVPAGDGTGDTPLLLLLILYNLPQQTTYKD
jgi:hypothetical protein